MANAPERPRNVHDLIVLLKNIVNEPSQSPKQKGWLVRVRSQEEFDAVQKMLKKMRKNENI